MESLCYEFQEKSKEYTGLVSRSLRVCTVIQERTDLHLFEVRERLLRSIWMWNLTDLNSTGKITHAHLKGVRNDGLRHCCGSATVWINQ